MGETSETLQAGLHRSKASQTAASLEASDRDVMDAFSTLIGLVKSEIGSKEATTNPSKTFSKLCRVNEASHEKERQKHNHFWSRS